MPDYCSLLNDDDSKPNSEDVIINAWYCYYSIHDQITMQSAI